MTDKSIKRSVTVAGHRTSITLEAAFWDSLRDIAAGRDQSVSSLIAEIDKQQPENLSSAIRVFVLGYYKAKS
jgi:predicted DNA-binding ribbon-helix-helix protein